MNFQLCVFEPDPVLGRAQNGKGMDIKMAARIIGTGSYVPENILTNDGMSKLVETSDEWISSRTGIRERRITMGESTSDLAIHAAKAAIEDAGISPEEIDLIIVATMTPDACLPNVACIVEEAVGANHALCFDMNAACTGFVYGLNTVAAYIDSGLAKMALLIGAETVSGVLDWNDRSTCVLFGDGAGAVIVKKSLRRGFIGSYMDSDASKKEALLCHGRQVKNPYIEEDKEISYIKMNGQEVFKFAITKVPECICRLLNKTHTRMEEIKYFVLHQANRRIITSVARRLKLEEEKFPVNVDRYGNTSAASIPILLDELNQNGQLKKGDKLILSGFGGGLTWAAVLIEW